VEVIRADDPGHEIIRELAWNEAADRKAFVRALGLAIAPPDGRALNWSTCLLIG
jgi:hypothetical protein